MKKLLPLLLLSATCLASCGETSYAGKYKFLLGREGQAETRIGVEMNLEDTQYVIPTDCEPLYTKEELEKMKAAKKLNVKFDLGSAFDEIFKVFDLSNGIDGYYLLLDETDAKYGKKMSVGVDFNLEDIPIPVTSELIRNLIVSYVDGQNVTLQLPVSLQDLQHQLIWYSGEYLDFDPYVKSKIHDMEDVFEYLPEILESIKMYHLDTFHELPGKKGDSRFGSHPVVTVDDDGNITKNEIAEVNELYEGYFSNTFVYENNGGVCGAKLGSIYEEEKEPGHYYFFPLVENFDESVLDRDVFVKENTGIISHEVSEVEAVLKISTPGFDNSYHCNLEYKDTSKGQWDWSTIMNEPFEFRDFYDIKVQLKKE